MCLKRHFHVLVWQKPYIGGTFSNPKRAYLMGALYICPKGRGRLIGLRMSNKTRKAMFKHTLICSAYGDSLN